MTCPTCGNAHSGECSVAALKARIAALETEASEAAMAAAVGEAVVATLRGEEVSDFMQSFGPVMEAQTVAHTNALLHGDVEAQRRVIVDACAHLRVTDDDEADWPKLPGAVLQLMEDHEAHRRQMAIALRLPEASTWAEMVAATSWDEATKLRGMVRDVLASLDRLTALLAAETERALKMEGERDEAISDREREVRRQNDAHGTLDKILNCPDCHGHGEIDTRHMVAGPHGEPEECGGVWRCDACEGTGIGDVAVLVKERDALRAQLAEHARLHAELNGVLHPKGGGPTAPSLCDLVSFVRADLAALTAKADPRIADLTAKVRGWAATNDDLRVLCDVAERVALLEALCAEKDEALADRQRLLDLVRHQRGPLHDAELISDEEYAALARDHGAVARLEGYDEARAKLAEAKATIARLNWGAH